MSQHTGPIIPTAHSSDGRGMPRILIVPLLELTLDIRIAIALQAGKPVGCLPAQHPFGLWQAKSHGSAPIQQPVDLGNGLAHLLLDTLDAKAGLLGDLGICEALNAMGEEDLSSSRL